MDELHTPTPHDYSMPQRVGHHSDNSYVGSKVSKYVHAKFKLFQAKKVCDTSLFQQGKIVAKLLPTEARLRDGRTYKVPQGQKSFKSKTKQKKPHHPKKKRKKSYSGHLLTASGGRQ